MTEITTPRALEEDYSSLRPQSMDEFVGQDGVRESLSVFVEAALGRGEALDHTLIYGPPGLGKTTLARLLATELGTEITLTSGPVLEKPGDLAGILTNVPKRGLLFIDEIHRLRPVVEEYLYPAMEDYRIEIRLGDGPKVETFSMPLQPFTLVGATTRFGLLTAPMRARFGVVERLDYYPPAELARIVRRSAGLLGIPITEGGADEIARRARGTPRVANRLLRRVRDFAEVRAAGRIDSETAGRGLRMLHVDEDGLNAMDGRVLKAIIEAFGGGPVGLASLAVAVGEDQGTLEEVYEPYLIQNGFLQRTPRGRVATPKAYARLGMGGGLFGDGP